MNREQKIALSLVIIILIALISSAVAFVILYSKVGMPKATAALAFMGITGLGMFPALFFKKDKGKVTFDERDKIIRTRAARAGFAMAYLFVGLACMIPFSVLGQQATISVRWLPRIFAGSAICMMFFCSLTLLFEYGRSAKDDKE